MSRTIIRGGRVIDAAAKLDAVRDVVIEGDRIAAVEASADVRPDDHMVNATGLVVSPGLIDLHVHAYEWATGFGLPPDDVGVNAGVTTCVDMGSAGAWTIPGFAHHIADCAVTEFLCFINVTLIGSMQGGGRGGRNVFDPEFTDADAIVRMHDRFPSLVRGIKTYAESGGWSHGWTSFLTTARQAGDAAGIPLYIHTGELLAVDEDNRPEPRSVMREILDVARPGDILGHSYSGMPDGVLGNSDKPSAELLEALDRGVLLDIGHGLNFSFRTARTMIDNGLLPHTVSSDVHGALTGEHDESPCTWSMVGTISKLVALGIPLVDVIGASTYGPAQVLKMQDEIGTLRVGSRADVTLLRNVPGPWVFRDSAGEELATESRYLPELVFRAGAAVSPSRRLLRDVLLHTGPRAPPPPRRQGEATRLEGRDDEPKVSVPDDSPAEPIYGSITNDGPPHDLPAGGRRIVQQADGYDATVMSGVATYRDGVPTGRLSGRLVRGAKSQPV